MNEVVIGAPYSVTTDLMNHFKVSVVCHGQTEIPLENGVNDPYAVPKTMGKFISVDSGTKSHWINEKIIPSNSHSSFIGNTMTTEKIVERIIAHRIDFEQRNLKKEKKEIEAYEALTKAKQNEMAG